MLWQVVQIFRFAKAHEKPHKNVMFQSPAANIYSVSRVLKSNVVTPLLCLVPISEVPVGLHRRWWGWGSPSPPVSCVLSSPSPSPSPSPLDPDCFWIVQMTVDCPLRGIVCAWGPFTPIYPWLILRLKCIWPNAEEWHLIDEAKSCSNKQVWPFDLLWSL